MTKSLSSICNSNEQSLGRETPSDFLFRYIDLSSVYQGVVDWQKTRILRFSGAPSRARRVVRNGDVLFSTVRPNLMGHAIIRADSQLPLIASTGFAVLTVKDGNDGRFIFNSLFLDRFRRQVAQFEVGSNYPAINESDLARVEVARLDGQDQSRIADILDTIDEAIIETDALLAKLTVLRLGLVEDLCSVSSGSASEISSDDVQDAGWELGRLGDWLITIEQGWSPDCSDEPTPYEMWGVLKTTSVVWAGWDDTQNKRLPSGLAPRPALEVSVGDVLMTRAGPDHRVGVVAYVNRTQGKLMLSDKLYRLVPKPELTPEFLALALSTDSLQRQISSFKSGMAQSQMNISQAAVRKMHFSKPSIGYQEETVGKVGALDDRIEVEKTKLRKLNNLRTALRDDLLTGRVPVVKVRQAAE